MGVRELDELALSLGWPRDCPVPLPRAATRPAPLPDAVWRATGENLPYSGVWPTSISAILGIVRERPALALERALPRYYPSQGWILHVPGLRELLTWNCLLLLRCMEGAEFNSPRNRESIEVR